MANLSHAGGVVFRRFNGDDVRYLIVNALGNSRHWVLPKGHIEKGETSEAAAVREVREESGVMAKVIIQIDIDEFEAPKGLVRVVYYLMEYLGEETPQEDRKTRWRRFDDAITILTFEGSRTVLTKAHALQ